MRTGEGAASCSGVGLHDEIAHFVRRDHNTGALEERKRDELDWCLPLA